MICILLSDDGKIFKVMDPKTKKDITAEYGYECNALEVQLHDGRWIAGFHIGIDNSIEIAEAMAAAVEGVGEDLTEDDEEGTRTIGDGLGGEPTTGGRYGRGEVPRS